MPTVLDKVIYDVIISLAQYNSPEILYRFTRANPKFFKKLLQIEPNLKTSELLFAPISNYNFPQKRLKHTLL
ncbi:hypothetical protein ACFOWU_12830 [Epilithonimonas zeae]|uniref:hypothetical protein n=1 Tax=Epilithonimonas zeae TaxID=1416779 RepID=UPI0011151633|nr:hypothetical protein [Epilithonimonas zeae]